MCSGVAVGAFCCLQGDQGPGKQGEGTVGPPTGEAPLHLERPGIEAHVPAWWVVLALEGPAWAVPSAMNFSEVMLSPLEPPFAKEGRGRGPWREGGQEVARKKVRAKR